MTAYGHQGFQYQSKVMFVNPFSSDLIGSRHTVRFIEEQRALYKVAEWDKSLIQMSTSSVVWLNAVEMLSLMGYLLHCKSLDS